MDAIMEKKMKSLMYLQNHKTFQENKIRRISNKLYFYVEYLKIIIKATMTIQKTLSIPNLPGSRM